MKTILLTVLLIAVSVIAKAQNTPALWKHTCNCGAGMGMTQDANRNSYVLTENAADSSWVIKLSPTGQQKFKKTFFPSSGYSNANYKNAFYKNGYIYLAGSIADNNFINHFFLTKIDTSGTLINQVIIDTLAANPVLGIKSAFSYTYGLYLDQQDNIHVGFTTQAPNFLTHYQFLRFDLNLNLTASYDHPLSFIAAPGPFYVNAAGEVYFTYTNALCKLNSSYSGIAWTDSLVNYSIGNMISADNNGNVWMIRAELSTPSFYLHKITDLGNSFQPGYDQFIYSSTVTADLNNLLVNTNDSSVYLAGREYGSWPYIQHVYKLDAMNGSLVWQDTLYDNLYVDLQVDSLGQLLAIGGGDNYYIWYYTNNGNLAFTFIYDAPVGGNDGIHVARLENNNRIVVTGSASENASTINWGTTLKYTIPNISTSVNEVSLKDNVKIFPVPAQDKIYIQNLPGDLTVTLSDLSGRKISVAKIRDHALDISSLPPGLYTLEADNGSVRMLTRFVKEN